MLQSIQKVIKIGTNGGVTIPAKALKQHNISFGDEVEVIVRPLKNSHSKEYKKVINSAKKIMSDYKSDFIGLSKR